MRKENSPDDTESNLNERVDQRLKLALDSSSLDPRLPAARGRQNQRPEVDAVGELPVVDGLVRVLFQRENMIQEKEEEEEVSSSSSVDAPSLSRTRVRRLREERVSKTNLSLHPHRVPKMNRKLSNVSERVLISGRVVEAVDLGRRVLHEVDGGKGVDRGGFAGSEEGKVDSLRTHTRIRKEQRKKVSEEEGNEGRGTRGKKMETNLENHILHTLISSGNELPDGEETSDSSSVGTGGPKLEKGLFNKKERRVLVSFRFSPPPLPLSSSHPKPPTQLNSPSNTS